MLLTGGRNTSFSQNTLLFLFNFIPCAVIIYCCLFFFLSYANVRKVCPEVCTFLCYVRPLGQDRGTSHFSGNFLRGEESVLVYYQRGKKIDVSKIKNKKMIKREESISSI